MQCCVNMNVTSIHPIYTYNLYIIIGLGNDPINLIIKHKKAKILR